MSTNPPLHKGSPQCYANEKIKDYPYREISTICLIVGLFNAAYVLSQDMNTTWWLLNAICLIGATAISFISGCMYRDTYLSFVEDATIFQMVANQYNLHCENRALMIKTWLVSDKEHQRLEDFFADNPQIFPVNGTLPTDTPEAIAIIKEGDNGERTRLMRRYVPRLEAW